MSRPAGAVSVDQMLAQARARLRRLSPRQAHQAVAAGAVLVDIRPAWQRAEEGEVPGALLVERNHLEWRFDPECAARLLQATGYDIQAGLSAYGGQPGGWRRATCAGTGVPAGSRGRAATPARQAGTE